MDALKVDDRVRHQTDGRLGRVTRVFVASQDAYYLVEWDSGDLVLEVPHRREELLAIREASS